MYEKNSNSESHSSHTHPHPASTPVPAPAPGPPNDDLLRSPPLPNSPAPAYTTLPYRDVEFHLAPLLNDRVGDIELETIDGKRFLVHRKVLEAETVFFHIYYGFVPVWRLNAGSASTRPPVPTATSDLGIHIPTSRAPDGPSEANAVNPLNSLLCLPKFLTSHLRAAAGAITAPSSSAATDAADVFRTPPPAFEDVVAAAPPPPPKDVTAPTPTVNPYTWAVPESSRVLEAFLSLIYPRGTFTRSPDSLLVDLETTARVARAALGYQSQKALGLARDKMYSWINDDPVGVYAMAVYFRFTDLARLASTNAIRVPREEWPNGDKILMGRHGRAALQSLQQERNEGLRAILEKPMESDEHSATCVRRAMIEELWSRKTRDVEAGLRCESELLELLEVDLRGGHCGDCLVLLGKTIQRCLYEAKGLPRSI